MFFLCWLMASTFMALSALMLFVMCGMAVMKGWEWIRGKT